jgi:tRNA(Ile)-lysidine synthase
MQLSGKDTLNPLSNDDFENLMGALDIGAPWSIAVAVSGGADSLALTLLLNQHCKNHNIRLVALTVDHGLREKSEKEAEQVKFWLAAQDIDLHILTWIGHKPNANIHDEARNARYRLMGQWCADNEVSHLFLAHHKQDQAETFLMRLFRGSGIDGLSAMKKVAEFPTAKTTGDFPKIYRPLLDVNKSRLEDYLRQRGQEWIEDPSNENKKFTRVQVRDLMQNSEIEGLNADRLSATAQRMRRVRSLLEELSKTAESDYVIYNEFGFACLDRNFHKNLHEEISLRLLSEILKNVSGSEYPPRHQKLTALLDNLETPEFAGQTLSGVIIFQYSESQIIFARELRDVPVEINISKAKQCMWDSRYLLEVDHISGKVVPIDENILGYISEVLPDLKERLATIFEHHQLRDRILPSLPCIIDDNGKVMLPDFLLSALDTRELDGFSAVFKK